MINFRASTLGFFFVFWRICEIQGSLSFLFLKKLQGKSVFLGRTSSGKSAAFARCDTGHFLFNPKEPTRTGSRRDVAIHKHIWRGPQARGSTPAGRAGGGAPTELAPALARECPPLCRAGPGRGRSGRDYILGGAAATAARAGAPHRRRRRGPAPRPADGNLARFPPSQDPRAVARPAQRRAPRGGLPKCRLHSARRARATGRSRLAPATRGPGSRGLPGRRGRRAPLAPNGLCGSAPRRQRHGQPAGPPRARRRLRAGGRARASHPCFFLFNHSCARVEGPRTGRETGQRHDGTDPSAGGAACAQTRQSVANSPKPGRPSPGGANNK